MTTTFVVVHWIPKFFKESFKQRNTCSSFHLKKNRLLKNALHSGRLVLSTVDQRNTSLQPKITWLENHWTWSGTKGKCDAVVTGTGKLLLEFTPVEDSLCYKVHYGPLELPCSWKTTSKNQILIDNWKSEHVYRVQIYTLKRDFIKEQLIFQGKLLYKEITKLEQRVSSLQDAATLEIRVGKIISCKKHPNADNLFVEEIDIGEDTPRTIVSGLVKYYEPENLVSKKVLVLCNLKPKKMRGIESKGMLLCGSTKDKSNVEPLSPPENAKVGELVYFDGCDPKPTESGNQASKSFERIVTLLKTDSKGFAFLEDRSLLTSQGPCFCSIANGNIS